MSIASPNSAATEAFKTEDLSQEQNVRLSPETKKTKKPVDLLTKRRLSIAGEKDKKKLVVACIGCRKKKIKCSSDRPACSNCLRLNIPCEYPVIRNRGSRFGYMEMLNRRMQHLEKYINCSTNPDYHPQFVTIHKKPQDATLLPLTSCGSTRGTVNSGYTNIRSTLDLNIINKQSNSQETETLITQLAPRLTSEIASPPSLPSPSRTVHDRYICRFFYDTKANILAYFLL